ncbi:MAG: ATP-binding protein, partial [Oscillospiraceae bacterium]
VYVSADGRHLWRIIDNLLGNCTKYALEGTRVYVDVLSWDGDAVISVKNVSREALNVQPNELMERFVRGEESRSTEGSGLGLSIARSLTELQGGTFRIDIDGDLFKASVRLPILP